MNERNSFVHTALIQYIQDAFLHDNFQISNSPTSADFPPTMQFSDLNNEILVLEQLEASMHYKFFLWIFTLDLSPSNKSVIAHKIYPILLHDDNNKMMDLNSSDHGSAFGIFLSPNNCQKSIVLGNDSFLFVSRIEAIQKQNDELHFHQISNFSEIKIQKLKWLSTSLDHLAILTNTNIFSIFDVNEDLDSAEFSLDLNSFEKEATFVDFTHGHTKDFFDMSYFAMFFLSERGEIFYLPPIVLNNMIIAKEDLDFLMRRVACDESLGDEIFRKVTDFCSFIKEGSILKDGKYCFTIKDSEKGRKFNRPMLKKFEIFENCKNSKINKSIFQLLHKLEGFIYHNFLRIDRKGTITILTTNQNIWPYDDLNKKLLELAVIDKIRLRNENYFNESVSIFPDSEHSRCLIIFGRALFELDLRWVKISEENGHKDVEFEYKKTQKTLNVLEILLQESEQAILYYGYLVFGDFFLILLKKGPVAEVMFYPTNSFVVLEDIENFNQNLKSIPLEMVKKNSNNIIERFFPKIENPIMNKENLKETIMNLQSYTDDIDNFISGEFVFYMEKIIKMKEFSQEITRFNEKCKESFLDLKHFIEKNDIKQLNERIFEKNNELKEKIIKISKMQNTRTREYLPDLVKIMEKFSQLKSNYENVNDNLKKTTLHRDKCILNSLGVSPEHKQKVEDIIKKTNEIKLLMKSIENKIT